MVRPINMKVYVIILSGKGQCLILHLLQPHLLNLVRAEQVTTILLSALIDFPPKNYAAHVLAI